MADAHLQSPERPHPDPLVQICSITGGVWRTPDDHDLQSVCCIRCEPVSCPPEIQSRCHEYGRLRRLIAFPFSNSLLEAPSPNYGHVDGAGILANRSAIHAVKSTC